LTSLRVTRLRVDDALVAEPRFTKVHDYFRYISFAQR
jgi:hypothetical protein